MKDSKSAYDSTQYDGEIRKSLPYYDEFHKQVIDIVKATGLKHIDWLDTGCGTGKTAFEAISAIKDTDISFTLCDISEKMLEIAKEKLSKSDIIYRNISSGQLDYSDHFDIVTAIQSHHYLSKKDRITAVTNCYKSLRTNGIFIAFENICFSNEETDRLALKRWENYMLSMGKTPEEVEKHLQRRNREYFPITINEHISLLNNCGFKSAELLWMSYTQAGFIAIK